MYIHTATYEIQESYPATHTFTCTVHSYGAVVRWYVYTSCMVQLSDKLKFMHTAIMLSIVVVAASLSIAAASLRVQAANMSTDDLFSVLERDAHERLGPGHPPVDFTCDLQCGLFNRRLRRQAGCRTNARLLHVAYILDSAEWLAGALASAVSLLVTSGGHCGEWGAFHFHLIVPSAQQKSVTKLMAQSTSSSTLSLANIVSVHPFREPGRGSKLRRRVVEVPTSKFARSEVQGMAAGAVHSPQGLRDIRRIRARVREAQRLNRASNFARFMLPEVGEPFMTRLRVVRA